jgi:hypothetical protein
MLDIGGDTGALVVRATEALLGREVEVSPAAAGRKRVHAVVHERQPRDGGCSQPSSRRWARVTTCCGTANTRWAE